jgi:hypothetical protein
MRASASDVLRLVVKRPRAPQVRCVTAPLRRLPLGCPLAAANLSSVPAQKSYDKCADQPVAANNRRLTRTTELPLIPKLA